jgi:DnaK suppressor protein
MLPQAMYNPGLFFPRQELKMPAKKAASKKRNKATTSRKKVAAKKTTMTKKKVAKKKAVSKKKAPARKKTSTRKVTKKVAKKKAAKKKAVSKKKVAKKVAKKKPAAKKKAASKKRPAAKKKAVSKKRPAAKKKVISKKRPAAKKKVISKKRPAAKKKVIGKKRPAAKKKVISKRRPAAKKKVPVRKASARKVPARRTKPKGNLLSGPIHGIAPYKPRRGEEYMGDKQLKHFRKILGAWKRELMYEVDRTVHHMQDEAANFPDPNDRATQESEFGLELRTRDRERKLLRKIDSALARIDEGMYGFCDETGEEIGLKRLEARPVATLCLEAQERRELAGRQFRDRDDRYR